MNSLQINLNRQSFHRHHRIMKFDLYNEDHTVIVTRSANILNRWIKKHKLNERNVRSVVGVGVQWNEGSYPAQIIQLAFKKQCVIYQIGQGKTAPQQLKRLLLNRRSSLVGVGNSTDAERISAAHPSLHVHKLINLRGSILDLAAKHLGLVDLNIDMEIVRSNRWGDARLSLAQVIHGAVDAFLSFKIGSKIV